MYYYENDPIGYKTTAEYFTNYPKTRRNSEEHILDADADVKLDALSNGNDILVIRNFEARLPRKKWQKAGMASFCSLFFRLCVFIKSNTRSVWIYILIVSISRIFSFKTGTLFESQGLQRYANTQPPSL